MPFYKLSYKCKDYEHYHGDGTFPSKSEGIEIFEAANDDDAKKKIPALVEKLLKSLYNVTPIKLERGSMAEIMMPDKEFKPEVNIPI